MAIEIKNETIVGTIDNLQEKLNGELPINRSELLYLVNSWGRNQEFDTNDNIIINQCKPKECYDLSKLDTSEITDMNELFKSSKFNGDISNWDVSKVTSMSQMFLEAPSFNQALNKWDVSNVTDMKYMFYRAKEFNQPLNNWDVSSVIDMSYMFYSTKFNQDINNWDVSKVTSMSYMFQDATEFNQALNNWDVSNVTNMKAMFNNAKSFNQALNDWDVSKVTDMSEMFFGTPFNQDINNWDVSNVKSMYNIFWEARNFNQPLNNWDVSKVSHMNAMFFDAIAFEKRFNNGNPLPEGTNDLKQWLKENRDKMLAIETLNKESTPEYKMAIIENKINNNKTTLDELFKEKNIDPNSKVGLETLKVYNDTHDKLKLELEELKTQVVDITNNDLNSL